MAHQTNGHDSTRNTAQDVEVHGSLLQIGRVFVTLKGLRPAHVLVGAGLFTAASVALALLVSNLLHGRATADDTKSVTGRPRAIADAQDWNCGQSAVVPKLKVGPDGRKSFHKFPSGGILVSGSSISIVLQGNNDEELILTGARAEIVARHRPAQGTHVAAECGSDVPARNFTVDLDRERPPLKIVPDTKAESTSRELTNWSYAVKVGDAEKFVVTPQSTEYDTEFRILIPWNSGGHSGTLVVDDGGKPFRVTATTAAAPTCFGRYNGRDYWMLPADSSACYAED
ncbi:hypothetical protein SGFS_010740 [Streptomyces graminofaciens]|uniref:Uncharacterized protein n=1 Tax=Streptomyces graminofaciens TaxID=68212 RepID=A0ABN5VAV7_9ACTN|nr:hypothetical protein [Streptomyces graminofaciens]BBC29780.1 hypothetical protein SGFS_010740 [Streptomyces graminofaciens]